MKKAVISGDIIASTAIEGEIKEVIETKLKDFIQLLEMRFGIFGRVIKGDYLECYVPGTENVLRIALLIKSYVKTLSSYIDNTNASENKRLKFFKIHGIRLAIGIGELSRLDPVQGVMDGEAIYYSGRLINERKTYDKEKITIKQTLFIKTFDPELDNEFDPVLALIDEVMERSTAKQSEVLYYKLLGYDEKKISSELKRSQSTINQHSTNAGWYAIEKAVKRFEQVIENKRRAL